MTSRAIDDRSGGDAAHAARDKAAGLPAEIAGPDPRSRTARADTGPGAGPMPSGAAPARLWGAIGPVSGRLGARALRPAGVRFPAPSPGPVGV